MLYIALVSFSGVIEMAQGEIRELTDQTIIDDLLRAGYIKEYDERNLQIQILARNTTMQILLWLGCVATIIAGYFSVSVSVTILACTFVSAATSLIMILYYSKKRRNQRRFLFVVNHRISPMLFFSSLCFCLIVGSNPHTAP